MLTYSMTPAQSDDWTLGGAAAAQVAQAIADQVAALDVHEDVLVLVDDGSVAFQLEQGRA
jgi:hypothetical protein